MRQPFASELKSVSCSSPLGSTIARHTNAEGVDMAPRSECNLGLNSTRHLTNKCPLLESTVIIMMFFDQMLLLVKSLREKKGSNLQM